MLKRRLIIFALGASALVPTSIAHAQSGARTPFRIGYIGNSTPDQEKELLDAFRRDLSERGYTEGKNITVEYRWAKGSYERLPPILADVIKLNLDVLVVSGTPAALAAKKATNRPVVFAAVGDAVGTGIVPNLAKPGGNITGLTATQLEAKRIQIIRELAPGIRSISVLANMTNPLTRPYVKSTLAASKSLGMSTHIHDVKSTDEVDKAFMAIVKAKPDALVVLADRVLLAHRKPIVQFAKQEHLPAIYPFSEFVEEGGANFLRSGFCRHVQKVGHLC